MLSAARRRLAFSGLSCLAVAAGTDVNLDLTDTLIAVCFLVSAALIGWACLT